MRREKIEELREELAHEEQTVQPGDRVSCDGMLGTVKILRWRRGYADEYEVALDDGNRLVTHFVVRK